MSTNETVTEQKENTAAVTPAAPVDKQQKAKDIAIYTLKSALKGIGTLLVGVGVGYGVGLALKKTIGDNPLTSSDSTLP